MVLISGIWCGAGFWGLSFSNSLWMFYIIGAAMVPMLLTHFGWRFAYRTMGVCWLH